MLNSTRAFFYEAKKVRGYGLLKALHGYVYLRWPYRYIAAALYLLHPPRLLRGLAGLVLGERSAERVHTGPRYAFSQSYHAKVLPLDAARRLIEVGREIRLHLPEKIIPYSTARDIVLANPMHVAVLDCPCRAARANPCLPLGVCLIVGEPFASFVVEHHPRRSRRITAAEAIEIMHAERARGRVQHAFFKDAMFGRFFAICNCCGCCCVAMEMQRAGAEMLASSGFVAVVDEGQCLGCGNCVRLCQFDALSVVGDMCRVDNAKCMGCGVCEAACGVGAVRLARDASKGEPLEI